MVNLEHIISNHMANLLNEKENAFAIWAWSKANLTLIEKNVWQGLKGLLWCCLFRFCCFFSILMKYCKKQIAKTKNKGVIKC